MLPDTGFDHAVQDTSQPGDEIKAMGDFLPNVSYTSTAKFESKGCTRL
ncbi:hypothetical protein [Streptomyces sp. AcE210]|nr:hypothetical protein [Streptomyces sp. AcE210]